MIHFVIGTRAQIFKMAPIMLECERRGLEWRWIYAVQHKETIQQTLDAFGLPKPDYTVFDWETEANTMSKYWYWFIRIFLKLPKGKQILGGYTGKDHILLTHGDTSSTLWGAVLGRLFRTQVMHVESGLRSFNIFEPFPEELNRIFTFWFATSYACPGEWALGNVQKYKGYKFNTIENTQVDTVKIGLEKADQADIELPENKYVVVSSHRYENVFKKERFDFILQQVEKVAERGFDICMVQHPVTSNQLDKFEFRQRLDDNPRIHLLPRLEYLDFTKLIKKSEFVMTDGGGNQEELYHMGIPTLILRKSTERQEGLDHNALLSELEEDKIDSFLDNYEDYRQEPTATSISPSKMIVDEAIKLTSRTV